MKSADLKMLALVLGGMLMGCGGGGDGVGASSGLPRASTIASLDQTAAGKLCDWSSSKQGGYGRSVTCSDGSVETTDANRANCVAAFPLIGQFCPSLTVGDVEDCTNETGTALCAFHTAAACAAVRACLQ